MARQSVSSGEQIIGRSELVSELSSALFDHDESRLLRGASGSGKSAMLDVLTARAPSRTTVVRLAGSETSRHIDFSTVARLLDADALHDLSGVQLLAKIRHAIADPTCRRRRVVIVDDVNHVDDASATVLSQLVNASEIVFLGSLRSTESVPSWIGDLLQRDVMKSTCLPGLDRCSSDGVARDRLGGAVAAEVLDDLWSLALGNPLAVVELVAAAKQAGALHRVDDEWQLVDQLPLGATLVRQIDTRLANISSSARDTLDLVALTDDGELGVLERLAPTDDLTELERSGLMSVVEHGIRFIVTISNPLVRRRCLEQMPTTRRRGLTRRLAAALTATGARRSGDALRVVDWSFESGQRSEPGLLAIAASEALKMGDHGKAARMVGASIDAGGGFNSYLVGARVFAAQGSWADSELAAMTASSLANDDYEVAEAAVAHSRLLARGGGTLAEARAIVLAAAERVSFGAAQERLEVEHARLAAIGGDLEEALELASRIPVPTTNALGLERLALCVHAHLVAGRFGTALELSSRGLSGAPGSDQTPDDRDEPLVSFVMAQRCEALLMRGETQRAAAIVESVLAASDHRDDCSVHGVWLFQQARVSAMTGMGSAALDQIKASARALAAVDSFGWRSHALATWSLMAAQIGDREQCETALAQLQIEVDGRALIPTLLAARAQAWLVATAGDDRAAIVALDEAASRAFQSGHLWLAAETAFDAVRLGGASEVADLLEAIASVCESDLVRDWSAHAKAAVDEDLAALDQLSVVYAKRGLVVIAAEAALRAGGALDGADGEGRGRFRVRAATLLADSHAAPPAASAVTRVQSEKRVLTGRQEQIARLAVDRSNSEIARELSISVRTVENHLNAAYQRLGVHRRTDLAGVFALTDAN